MLKKAAATRSKLLAAKERLDEADIPWAIFAGAATRCYGSKRSITDIDILVRCEDLDKARASLKGLDLSGLDIGCGAEIPTPQGKCLFFLDQEMIEKRQWKQLFGTTVPVMSPEDSIVLKAILQRGTEEGKHDIQDIRDIMRNQKIDEQYLKGRIKKCHSKRRVEPILQPYINLNESKG